MIEESPARKWFGEHYEQLHPALQSLHSQGGKLSGVVEVRYGKGISGYIARRLARKLNIPEAGTHDFSVTIAHEKGEMKWQRQFDDRSGMTSVFVPVGTFDNNGYWREKIGAVELHLTVEIRKGGWYWRCLRAKIFGITLPLWLFPETTAYKAVENGVYQFYVGFRLPLLGFLLSYSGRLTAG
ncbi:hypothetical protein BTA51_27270 [Hahella sp. CCB-MM4]|uniref:DUF4166 domain-containing protein n=1 Tax=Hahella sp. (strain CCB-MM4) TaxID=1926491 RepID=UPI000B9C62DB|nr:DUF4166 domain-containing protein [Hahella sp. CCB-MM4]OZG70178.1 hypothetical protein BTA51_27270 [Hahella sp. CCB-MM4]